MPLDLFSGAGGVAGSSGAEATKLWSREGVEGTLRGLVPVLEQLEAKVEVVSVDEGRKQVAAVGVLNRLTAVTASGSCSVHRATAPPIRDRRVLAREVVRRRAGAVCRRLAGAANLSHGSLNFEHGDWRVFDHFFARYPECTIMLSINLVLPSMTAMAMRTLLSTSSTCKEFSPTLPPPPRPPPPPQMRHLEQCVSAQNARVLYLDERLLTEHLLNKQTMSDLPGTALT